MRLKDKVVLVTAATKGIGLACVKSCAENGARVYMGARNMEEAETVAERLNSELSCHEQRKGLCDEQLYPVRSVCYDATKAETYASMMEQVVSDAGRLDVLVNNFGISDTTRDLDFQRTDCEFFLDIVRLNLQSVFLSSQLAAKHMFKGALGSQGGCIINISSVGGTVPDISQAAYGTSKAAINYLTKLIAVQGAASKLRCNAVLPGMTATESVKKRLNDDFKEAFLRHVPLGRVAEPEEIAAAVVYLASDAAEYVTGQILEVSGGFGIPTPLYADWSGSKAGRS